VPYARDNAEWDRLVDAGLAFLLERARLRKVTSYTELNAALSRRTGARPFDFEQDGERRAMGALLETIGERNRSESGLMITALVSSFWPCGPVFTPDPALLARLSTFRGVFPPLTS
jgi:hypothetical protein